MNEIDLLFNNKKNIYLVISKQNKQENKKMSERGMTNGQYHNNLATVFDKHINCEFEEKDVQATMHTMVKEPYVHHVPILTGGIGYEGVYDFYRDSFIGKMPSDTKFVQISRTIGNDQVVDELVLSFTHDIEIPAMLPEISPTGRYIELPLVVVMKFKGNKIEHEHIYWDQASLLLQIGLLDNKKIPITGIEQSKRLQELALLTLKTTKTKTISRAIA